jgi:S-adenosylmethionine:tRNA ribosyltransferase-isomerase
MHLDAFDYELPPDLIAQEPLPDRTASRLMVVDRDTGDATHEHFRDLPSLLDEGDLLVLNRSRVMPARLFVMRPTGGQAELFVVRIDSDTRFRAIGSPLRKLKPGDVVTGENGDFVCRIVERVGEREVVVDMQSGGDVRSVLGRSGHVPLPPYIQRCDEPEDRDRYQTVFADREGSVAAPTAGLHFDNDLLAQIEHRGVRVEYVTLHVGLGTFLPLEHNTVEDNVLHSEEYAITGDTILAAAKARRSERRVVAVGTTTTRVMESVWREGLHERIGVGQTHRGATGLFVYPGYEFQIVDALVTNFHLPKSSLLLLVSAFLGRERTLGCYAEAVRRMYRFYSYGDAMFIR